MTRVKTWLAQHVESNPPRIVGFFFEFEEKIHHAFLGLSGVDGDFREHELDEEALTKGGVTSIPGFKNWLYYWTTMLAAGKGMGHFIEKESPYYAVIEGRAHTFDDGVSLEAICDELRAELLHVEGGESGANKGGERDPRPEDDVATLIEEGCWLVPRHGEALRQVAMWALRGGELDPESKRLKVRYAWLVEPLRSLYRALSEKGAEPYAAEISAVIHHAMSVAVDLHDGRVLDIFGRVIVNAFAKEDLLNQLDMRFVFRVLADMSMTDIEALMSDVVKTPEVSRWLDDLPYLYGWHRFDRHLKDPNATWLQSVSIALRELVSPID